jgi:hypothetical protein
MVTRSDSNAELDTVPRQSPPPQNLWRGELAKSSIPQCPIKLASASAVLVRQSFKWPSTLDMQHRITIPNAINVWRAHDASQRGVGWVLPDGDEEGFRGFVKYLEERERAGIMRPSHTSGKQSDCLYIIPPSQESCGQVGVPIESSGLLLLLIVTPP